MYDRIESGDVFLSVVLEMSRRKRFKSAPRKTRELERFDLFGLPEELIIIVLSHVESERLISLRRICKALSRLVDEESLWKLRFENFCADCRRLLIEIPTLEKPHDRTWRWFCQASTVPLEYSDKLPVGKVPYANGFYIGDISEKKPHGYGIRTYRPGTKDCRYFQGIFDHGKRVRGKVAYVIGDIYEGEWEQGVRHGFGTYVWTDVGDSYIGSWRDGNIDGSGDYFWKDGRIYRGQWKEHNQEGIGVFNWPDGSVYAGEWKKGKRHGAGVIYWSDGEFWSGRWDNDERRETDVFNLTTFRGAEEASETRRWDNFFKLSFSLQRESVKDFREKQEGRRVEEWIKAHVKK